MTKLNTTYSIRPAVNGFIVEKSWTEREGDNSNWKNEIAVFFQWDEVITFLKDNQI